MAFGPVYLKPNLPSVNRTHVLCRDGKGEDRYIPNDTDVEILDRISNFDNL
jgi:hypothetical protein